MFGSFLITKKKRLKLDSGLCILGIVFMKLTDFDQKSHGFQPRIFEDIYYLKHN